MKRTPFFSALFAASFGLATLGAAADPAVAVRDAWSRPAVDTGAAYFTIVNGGKADDRLVEAASPAAAHVELHESLHVASPGAGGMQGPSAMSGMSGASMSSGAIGMKRVDAIVIPAGGTVTLKPGGYHVMLIGLKQPLKAGDSVKLHLRFAKAGTIDVTAPVRETTMPAQSAPASAAPMH